MAVKKSPFDDFVDDCFIGEDPLCNISQERSLELVASQLITELLAQDNSMVLSKE